MSQHQKTLRRALGTTAAVRRRWPRLGQCSTMLVLAIVGLSLGTTLRTASAGLAPPAIYWTVVDDNGIKRANLDGSDVSLLVQTDDDTLGIALDVAGGLMYWTVRNGIWRANLDATDVTLLIGPADVGANPFGLALDLPAGKLYWTENSSGCCPGSIHRANLDGTGVELLIADQSILGIALDLAAGKMYFGHSIPDHAIERANLDGTGLEVLVAGQNFPLGASLDLAAGKMYWTTSVGGGNPSQNIKRANLDGSAVELLYQEQTGGISGLALDVPAGKMYWTSGSPNSDARRISRANLDGSGVEVVIDDLTYPFGIAVIGSSSCSSDAECTGDNLCVTDSCDLETGLCVFDPIVDCDDGNVCTADTCVPATGECTNIQADDCSDGVPCTTDSCDSGSGECVNVPVECPEGLFCAAGECVEGGVGDECEECIAVGEGDFAGTTSDNTGDLADSSCGFEDFIDEWYCYTASCTGTATASTCDQADFDSQLSVFDSCGGAELACNEDGTDCSGLTSEVSWPVTAGLTYYVRISGWGNETGDYILSLSCEAGCTEDAECDDGEDCTTDSCDQNTHQCINETGPACGLQFLTDPAEFEAAMLDRGKLQKTTETFEENDAGPGFLEVPDPLEGGVPNGPFPTGLDSANLIVQSNTLGGDPVNPNPGANLGLVTLGGGFGETSDVVFANGGSLDLIFTDSDKTGIGFDTIEFFGGGSVEVRVYDTANTLLGTATSPADEAGTNFFGIASDTPIGRVNISSTSDAFEGCDNIQMWFQVPPPVTFLTDPAEFEAAMLDRGKLQKTTETFEENDAGPGFFGLSNPLQGGVPNGPFPSGLDATNLIVQSNTLGGDPVNPSPGGDLGLLTLGGGFGETSDIVFPSSTAFDSLDFIFTDSDKTGIGFDTIDIFGGGSVEVRVYDTANALIALAVSPADPGGTNFLGISSNTPIGRVNIYSPGDGFEGGDNIQMWFLGEVGCQGPEDCDDGDACTDDTCDTGTGECSSTATDCDDGNACTADSCDPATGCVNEDTSGECNDGNACTADSCDPATGCVNEDTSGECNDGNACTADSCDPASGCVNEDTSGECNDGNACTADSCDPATGCVNEDTSGECNDGNACTADSCDPASGCVNEDTSGECNDGNACTADSCDPASGCVNEDTSGECNDGNACTADSCDPASGCVNEDTSGECDDGNACTADSCDPASGCVNDDISEECNDGNACTADSCDPASGCVNDDISEECNDGNACTADSCDPASGCVNEDIEQTLIIKQGATPAPLNPNGNGVTPILLVGTDDFDVSAVDQSSLDLHVCGEADSGVQPLEDHTKFSDLNHPFAGSVDCEGCTDNADQSSDGTDDLSMKFRTSSVVNDLGLTSGAVTTLELTGTLLDGSPFCARDCAIVVPPGVGQSNLIMSANVADTFVEVTPLDLNVDSDGFANFSRSYFEGTAVTLTAPVSSEGQKFMRWIVDGVMQPLGSRTVEVVVTEDTTLKAYYRHQGRVVPDRPTEDGGDLE